MLSESCKREVEMHIHGFWLNTRSRMLAWLLVDATDWTLTLFPKCEATVRSLEASWPLWLHTKTNTIACLKVVNSLRVTIRCENWQPAHTLYACCPYPSNENRFKITEPPKEDTRWIWHLIPALLHSPALMRDVVGIEEILNATELRETDKGNLSFSSTEILFGRKMRWLLCLFFGNIDPFLPCWIFHHLFPE